MLRTRVILVISAVILITLMFNLPKVVVDNGANDRKVVDATNLSPESESYHEKTDEKAEVKATALKEEINNADNSEKSIIFADSLAELYLSNFKYDSAAKFFEFIATAKPSIAQWQRAGDAYYEAYGFAVDRQKQQQLGEKAREYYALVLDSQPDNLDIKNKLAMTYLSTSNPMQGIMILRSIIELDPENEQALFNLGTLSMQSGQYDKAVERFSYLVKIYPNNVQAQFFLGMSYLETGNKSKAKEQFSLVKSLDSDPSVQATVDSYLQELE